jgi:hypothetical protein
MASSMPPSGYLILRSLQPNKVCELEPNTQQTPLSNNTVAPLSVFVFDKLLPQHLEMRTLLWRQHFHDVIAAGQRNRLALSEQRAHAVSAVQSAAAAAATLGVTASPSAAEATAAAHGCRAS